MPVHFDKKGRLARITLARPPLNILDVAHLDQLADAAEQIGDAAVCVVDAGDARVFCAGNDVADHSPDRAPEMLAAFHRAIRALLATDAVTVADVRGDAFGGGCEIVAACDLVYCTADARFGQPEIDVGCFPPVAAALLPRLVGWTRAAQLIFTGRRIDAATARDWGLVTEIAPAGPVVDELMAKSPAVLRLAKRALRAGGLGSAERVYVDELLRLEDCEEGVRAFMEKRPPRWEA